MSSSQRPVSPAAFLALARTKLEAGARQLRPLKDFLERVNLPSGLKGTEKRLFTNLSYYSSNYVLLCAATLTLFALFFDWWLVAAVLVGLAGAVGVLFAAQAMPLPARVAAATCVVCGAQLLFSTLASFLMAAGIGATAVAVHALLRPAGGSKGRGGGGSTPDGLPPETLSAFVGSLASDLDDLEARRRRSAAAAAADAEEGRGGGAGGYDAGEVTQQQPQQQFASPGVQQRRGGGAFIHQQQVGAAAWAPPFGGARAGGVSPPSPQGQPPLQQQQQRAPGGGAPFSGFQQLPSAAAGGFSKRAE